MPTHADYDTYFEKLRKWTAKVDGRLDAAASQRQQDKEAVREALKDIRANIRDLDTRLSALEALVQP